MVAAERAVVFVDGSNWYHGLKTIGVAEGGIDYCRLCAKLLGSREWVALRWYVGRVDQASDPVKYGDQLHHMNAFLKQDARISLHWGRIEPRPVKSEAAEELERYLGGLRSRLDSEVWGRLYDIARRHRETITYKEKAVDVRLAVDMVEMALKDEYDTAYLLSADGDFTPAVDLVRSRGKKVFAASASEGYALGQRCNSFILLKSEWFAACMKEPEQTTTKPSPPPQFRPRASRRPGS
jgi:uncharacterized LabA/DUF88 family protein